MAVMLTVPSLAVVFSVAVAIYHFIIRPAWLSPLAKIPNAHWSAPFLTVWILWTRYNHRENRDVHAAHQKLGPIVRLGPNEISINSIDGGIKTIYSGGFDKGDWYSIFDNYGVQCMFSTPHAREHGVRKRMISAIYSKSTIHNSPVADSQARIILYSRLLPILEAHASQLQQPKGVDVVSIWYATTMDFITAYQFGISRSSNFLKNASYRKHWLELFHGRRTYTFFLQELPRLTEFMHSIGIRLVPKWVDYANEELGAWTRKMCDITTSAIATTTSQFSDPADEPAVLRALIKSRESESARNGSESPVADTYDDSALSIASEMLDHLAAGFETSGITLTYLSWFISQDMSLQKALRSELLTLDSPIKYDPLTMPSSKTNDPPTWLAKTPLPAAKQLDTLPILHAVLMETLRLTAAIPGAQPRTSPYPSCLLAGYSIPGGVRVSSAAYSLHRNETAFPSPEKWDYTRWLDHSRSGQVLEPEAKRDRDRYFWAFSSGGRMCVGSNFAMHEIKLVLAAIYTNYTTHIVDDRGIEQEDGYTSGPESGRLILRFEKAVD